MALARSASGPGGLSINTGSANSLFGGSNANQQSAAGSLFGGASVSQAPATGGLFGSSNITSAPPSQGLLSAPQVTQSSGSVFGTNSNTTPNPQTSGGLLGSLTTVSQPQQSGGLFGSLNTATQPQQSAGLFANMNSQQPQQGPGPFGSLGSHSSQNQGGPTGGLFGSATTGQPAQSGGMFGNLNNQAQNKPTGPSLFGSLNVSQNQQPPQQQQQTGGLFHSLNKPAPSVTGTAFGGSLGGLKMGQSQGQQSVPGVRIDVSLMKGTTRFNDLHEDLQKQIDNIDKIILSQQAVSADCDAIMPSHATQLSSIPTDVEFLSRKLIGVESSLETDAEAVSLVGQLVKSDAEHAKLSFKATDNLKLPPQYHQGNWIAKSTVNSSPQGQDTTDPQDLVGFFSQTANEMSATLQKYQSHVSEIEQHLRSVEAAIMMQAQQLNSKGLGDDVGEQKRELAAVLREFEAGIRGVAGIVAETREGVQRLEFGGFVDQGERGNHGIVRRGGIY